MFFDFEKDEISEFVKDAINNNYKDRLEILHAAIQLDMDPNCILMNNISLLDYAIMKNDIATVGHLVKYGADINKKNMDGYTVLHLCAKLGNKHLLNFFLGKQIGNINELDDDGNTPLVLACYFGNEACTKLLLDNGADVNIKNKPLKCRCRFSVLDIVLQHIDNNKNFPKYIAILKLVIDARIEISKREIWKINDICSSQSSIKRKKLYEQSGSNPMLTMQNKLEIIKIVCTKFPATVNTSCDKHGNTLLHQAIMSNNKLFIEYLLTITELDLTKTNKRKMTYLHLLANLGLTDYLKIVLDRCDKTNNMLCHNGRTAIEYAILPCFRPTRYYYQSTEPTKTEQDIINIIRTLHAFDLRLGDKDRLLEKININSRNKFGFRAIECAIQNCSTNVVNEIINLGADITTPKQKNRIYPAISNNDLIGFAAQLGKLDTIKLLLSKNAPLSTFSIKFPDSSLELPSSLALALMHGKDDVVLFLLGLAPTQQLLNDQTKKYLLKLALDEGSNKNILKHFMLDDSLKAKTVPILKIQENKISRHVKDYYDKKRYVLKSLYRLLSLLDKIFTFNNNTKNGIFKIFEQIDQLLDTVAPKIKFIDKLVEIISNVLDYSKIEDIRHCIDVIAELQCIYADLDTTKTLVVELKKLPIAKKLSQIKKLLSTVNTLLHNCPDDWDNDDYDCDDYDSDLDSDDSDSDELDSDSDNCSDVNSESDSDPELDYYSDPESDTDPDSDSDYSYNSDNDDSDSDDEQITDSDNAINPIDSDLAAKSQVVDKPIDTNTNLVAKSQVERMEHSDKLLIIKPDAELIEKSLFKLCWPVKLRHYDKMLNLLTNPVHTYQDLGDKLLIFDGDNLIARIYRLNNIRIKFGSRWIRFYAPNIGSYDKNDQNHTFPFILDHLLEKWPCIEKRVIDPTHYLGSDLLIYFYGELLIDGKMVDGCFEYFINSFNTIFHRMFREYDALSPKIKDLINRTPTMS